MTDNDITKLIDAMKGVFATKEDLDVFPTAEMVKRGFDHVDEQFMRVEERLDNVGSRLDHVEGRLDHMDARMGRMEADLAEIRGNLVYRHEFEDLMARVKYVETKLGIESGK